MPTPEAEIINEPRPAREEPSEMAMGVAARCFTDAETEHINMDAELATAFAKRVDILTEAIETAWVIIANSSNWGDARGSTGWREAALQFRENCVPLMQGKTKSGHL